MQEIYLQQLKDFMARTRFKQKELAELFDCTPVTVCRMLKGQSVIPKPYIDSIRLYEIENGTTVAGNEMEVLKRRIDILEKQFLYER